MKFRHEKWQSIKRCVGEKGSMVLESACTVLIFVMVLTIFYRVVNVIRAERAVQLALDKTALQVSEYCYPAAAVGDALADGLHKTAEEKEKNGEKTSLLLKGAEGLAALGRGASADSYSAPEVAEDLYNQVLSSAQAGDITSLSDLFRSALSSYGDSPLQAVTAIAAGVGTYEASGLLSHAVAIPLCEILVPANFSAEDPDAYLRRCGVVSGKSGLDYSMSSVLPDGNEIRICAVYEVQVGTLIPWKMKIVQTAATGSWCTAGKQTTSSVWKLGSLARGKKFVQMAKSASKNQAVKAGVGFDLYDTASNTVTSVISLNVFAATYAKRTAGDENAANNASDYTLQEKKVKSALVSGAKKLKTAVDKCKDGRSISKENGGTASLQKNGLHLCLRVMIPEEASYFEGTLQRLAKEASDVTGVSIVLEKKEKALE